MDYCIKNFGIRGLSRNEVQDVSSLHNELLPHSPVVKMGPEFMEKFYYRSLIDGGLVCGATAYVDDDPAGFVVATNEPESFMMAAFRQHWLMCISSIGLAIVKRPARVMAMIEAYRIQKHVGMQLFEDGVGELLSFGVREKYRSRKFVNREQTHIAVDLLNTATAQLKKGGARRVRAVVDQDNLEAKFFYRANGWRIGAPSVGGWKVPTLEFLLDLD